MDKQSLLQSIIANLKATVNDYSLRKITAERHLDYDAVRHDLNIYRGQTVGDYARRAYGKRLAKRFIGAFIGRYYI